MAARTLPKGLTPGTFVLAASIPFIFLHTHYQPHLEVRGASIGLSDAAILAAFVATLAAARRIGLAPLTRVPWLWGIAAALLVVIAASTVYGQAADSRYRFGTHLVTTLKFAEYATLALAVVYLARTRAQLRVLLVAIVAWSMAMTTVALLQFLGVLVEFQGLRPGQREPAYVGIHDFAALSGGALAVSLAVIALGSTDRLDRGLACAGGVSGALGVALSGSVFALTGVGLAAAAAVVVLWRRHGPSARRIGAIAAIVAAVAAGVFGLRARNVEQFLSFLGINVHGQEAQQGASGSHRTVLAYIGGRIFLANPVFGVGWQGSGFKENYGPYLAAAQRRFPTVDPYDLPSPQHPWGVQNAYVQAAADMGVIGLAAFLATLAAAIAGAVRGLRRSRDALALVPLLWLLSAVAIWNALGFYGGIPQEAFTWLAFGLAGVVAGE